MSDRADWLTGHDFAYASDAVCDISFACFGEGELCGEERIARRDDMLVLLLGGLLLVGGLLLLGVMLSLGLTIA